MKYSDIFDDFSEDYEIEPKYAPVMPIYNEA